MDGFHTPLERGLAVIQAFSESKPSMSVIELSEKTGIPYSAVYRCLYTLIKLGFVTRQGRGCFAMAPNILLLSKAYCKPLSAMPEDGSRVKSFGW
ncbi:MAG: helix-turn-helix domain-containing protein [Pseudogulbenkiania sp.]|nr:helix-turn-helix domain-containing protein [Pseudogulbenkiania sp.]